MSLIREVEDFEVNVISRELIKPSSPTPYHKNSLKLSLLDQFAATFHTPIILFYQNDETNINSNLPIDHSSERSMALKKSLSETLVRFYPLAGRLRGNESIDCNDQGVEFCEANVSERLTKVLEHPNLEKLQALLPFESTPNHENIVLSVQVSHFACGGMAIGVRISHNIADTASATAFVKAWATTAQAQNEAVCPEFNAASLYPPVEELNEFYPGYVMTPYYAEKIVSKRVVFDKEKIDELKAQMGDDGSSKPTRVEVVSAFIWKHMMGVANAKIDTAMHAVNFRKRVVPQVPEETFGNFSCTTSTSPLVNGPKTEFSGLVDSLRKAINKIDDDYLTPKLKGDNPLLEISKERDNLVQGENKCLFSSWCSFPLYEVDFGIGRPIWACHGASPMKNVVVLWSTKCGLGIEAWVHMLEDHIATLTRSLEHDPLFT